MSLLQLEGDYCISVSKMVWLMGRVYSVIPAIIFFLNYLNRTKLLLDHVKSESKTIFDYRDPIYFMMSVMYIYSELITCAYTVDLW